MKIDEKRKLEGILKLFKPISDTDYRCSNKDELSTKNAKRL